MVPALTGITVLLTRPLDEDDRVAGLLSSEGAHVLRAPTIRFEPVDVGNLPADRIPILTSARAVEAVRGRVDPRVSVVTLAARTREKALEAGLRVLPMRDAVDGEDLAAAIAEHVGDVGKMRFVMVRSDVAEPSVVTRLRAMGADVQEVVGYRTIACGKLHDDVKRALDEGRVHAVVCMSPSQVRALLSLVTTEKLRRLVRVAPGKSTARAWEDAGLPAHGVADRPEARHIVEALVRIPKSLY